MANNYTQFSISFPVKPASCEWIETLLAKASAASGDDTDDKDLLAVFPDWNDHQCLGFQWNIEGGLNKAGKAEHAMWIRDDGEWGNVDAVANFMQAYLKGFEQDGGIGFEWANTCSSQRVGEFGGGACFVTAKNKKWSFSSQFLVTEEHAHGRAMAAARKRKASKKKAAKKGKGR